MARMCRSGNRTNRRLWYVHVCELWCELQPVQQHRQHAFQGGGGKFLAGTSVAPVAECADQILDIVAVDGCIQRETLPPRIGIKAALY